MTVTDAKPIVVGVSPTTGSPQALRWAEKEARLRGAPLVAVMAWRQPRTQSGPGVSPPAFRPAGPKELEVQALSNLTGHVVAALGKKSSVVCEAIRGATVRVLVDKSREADLVVIDSPHPGRRAPAIVPGVIAPQLAFRAPCPVVLVPPRGAEGQA